MTNPILIKYQTIMKKKHVINNEKYIILYKDITSCKIWYNIIAPWSILAGNWSNVHNASHASIKTLEI